MPTCAICICRTRALSKWPPDLTDPEWTIGQQQKRRAVGILAHDRLIVVAALILAVGVVSPRQLTEGGRVLYRFVDRRSNTTPDDTR